MLSRRHLIALLPLAIAGQACAAPKPASNPPAAKAATRPVVTILGDSITAGYGLRGAEALPAQLEAALGALGAPAEVRGAGVSGDTSAGGLARVDFSVRPDTRVCVVALGGNDLLQGVEPAETRANLDKIVRRLKARGITVVVAGGKAPAKGYGAFGREFDAVFEKVAKANGVLYAPDLLADISGHPEMRQADGLHPNAAGAKLVARRLAPVVARALKARR